MSYKITEKIYLSDLPTKAKFVLLCLAETADDFGITFRGITTLCQRTSMSERTVQRVLGYLKAKCWLETFWSPTEKFKYRQILHYRILFKELPERPIPNHNNCPKELREETIERFSYTCTRCNQIGTEETGPDGHPWEIERLIPGSRGGGYEQDNVTLSCRTCNRSGVNLTPLSGVKTGQEWCQNGHGVVSKRTDSGVNGDTRSCIELNPLNTNGIRLDCLDLEDTLTSKPNPLTEEEVKPTPQESYRAAKSIFRGVTRYNFGNLSEKYVERWTGALERYGEDLVLKALKLWAEELPKGKKLGYPVAVFLKGEVLEEYVEAVGIQPAMEEVSRLNRDPEAEDDDDEQESDPDRIRRERKEREEQEERDRAGV